MASATKKKKTTARRTATQKRPVAKKAASKASRVAESSRPVEELAQVEVAQVLATQEADPERATAEEPVSPVVSEEGGQEVESQGGQSGAQSLADLYMSIPSFRKRVIFRLIKKLG